jgi:methyltransferase family protein
VLNPGGSFVVVTPNAESWGLRLLGRNWQALDPPRHIHILSLHALETTVRAAGFENVYAYSTASRAWSTFAASLRLAELPRAGVTRPSPRILAKAFALSFREARMNLISRNFHATPAKRVSWLRGSSSDPSLAPIVGHDASTQ